MTMNWKYIGCAISFCLMGLLIASCQSDYTKLVKKELATGVRNDSLILGIRFGDTQNDFFGKCYDLNRAHVVTEGPGDGSVRYPLTDSLFHEKPTKISFFFKPNYDEKKAIVEMAYNFSYAGWSPWNKGLQSDSLQGKAMKILKSWYKGNDFIPVKVKMQDMFVKVDGNRQILVYIKDAQFVIAQVQDISSPVFNLTTPTKEKVN